MSSLDDISAAFLQIHLSRSHDARSSFDMASLSIDDAYEVQRRVIAARVARGEQVVGYKVGCTSRAIRRQFGLAEPICGRVMAPHVFHGNTVLNWNDYVCCAVEPEFVFGIAKNLSNEVTDDQQLVDAIEYIAPGIEIHNYKFWFGKPTLQNSLPRMASTLVWWSGQKGFAPKGWISIWRAWGSSRTAHWRRLGSVPRSWTGR